MTSVFDAPPIVFDPQTAPDPLVRWRGPRDLTLLFWEVDFRAGGASRLCLRSPEGKGYWIEGVHLEIVEPERIVFTGTLEIGGDRLPETSETVTFRRTERSEEE
jgi:uncharacterized protein YndB with AHSA1/START domain